MKRFLIPILAALMLLAACKPTPESEFVVMKDTERLVDTVQAKNPDETPIPTTDETIDNALVKTDRHYTYSYESANGLLHIKADADVYLPKTGKLPMARVKAGVLTDELAKAIFDKVFAGQPAYVDYYNQSIPSTKAQLAKLIADWQELVDTGRTETKDMSREEALELIERLKEQYKTAPDEATTPELVISDGSMLYRERTDFGTERWYELNAANPDVGMLDVRRPATDNGGFQYYLSYQRGSIEDLIGSGEDEDGRSMDFRDRGSYTAHVVNVLDMDCTFGQVMPPATAVQLCVDFLKDLGVTDVLPRPEIDAYTLDSGENCYYLIDFVRTVNGTQVAYLPMFQGLEHGDVALPWDYEHLRFLVDRDGIVYIIWESPTEVTKIESSDAAVLTYEQAIETFETMGRIVYEAKTEFYDIPYYIDVEVSRIELDLVRIREQDAPGRYGLYVPAWVFYGKKAGYLKQPVPDGMIDNRMEIPLLVINAIDGSIIDLEKGY